MSNTSDPGLVGRQSKAPRVSNLNDELNNPCLKEYRMATNCAINNAADKDVQCKDHFGNYRTCMKFWNKIQTERRIQGIRPLLPPPEEREEIKRKAFSSLRA